MNRRRYLRTLGSLAGLVAASGCSRSLRDASPHGTTPRASSSKSAARTGTTSNADSGPSAETGTESANEHETYTAGDFTIALPRFATVIDMVEDAGCDPTGREPCDKQLAAAADNHTLLQFPPGRYRVTQPLVLEDITDFGMRGTGTHRRDVRFIHPIGYSDLLVNVRRGQNCLFERFTAEQTDDAITNSGLVVKNADGTIVRDVEVAGFTPSEAPTPRQSGTIDLVVQITESEGRGLVERYVSTGGAEVGVYPKSYAGFYSGVDHRGTLRLVDCHLEECGSTGVYAGRTYGQVQVVGGRFKNNDVAQIRVSGKGSFVRDAEVIVDTADQKNSRGSFKTVRGIWWESGWQGKTGGYIEDCDLIARKTGNRRALIQIDGTAGAMTVRNCTLEVNGNNYEAIHAYRPGRSPNSGGLPDRPWNVELSGVDVYGTATWETAIKLEGRPNSVLSDVTVRQTGRNVNGIVLEDAVSCLIENTSVTVPNYPLVIMNDGPSVRLPGGASNCLVVLDKVTLVGTAGGDSGAAGRTRLVGTGAGSRTCIDSNETMRGKVVLTGPRNGRYVWTTLSHERQRTT